MASKLPDAALLPTHDDRLGAWIAGLRPPHDADAFWAAHHADLHRRAA